MAVPTEGLEGRMARLRNRRSWVVKFCVGVLALNMLGACQLVRRGPEQAAAAPTTAAVSMADYAGRLSAGVDRIESAISLVASSKSYDDLRDQLSAAQATLSDAVVGMRGLAVPVGAKAAHDRFVGLLSDLDRELGHAATAVGYQELCAAPSVMARLNQSGVVGHLEAAGQELAAVTDGLYKPVELVPGAPARTRRLSNGAMVRRPSRSGTNHINIDNRRRGVDVVVTMARGKRPFASVYVRRKSKATIAGIPDGTYTAYFTSGNDWDRALRAFTRDCTFERFKLDPKFNVRPRYYTYWDFWITDDRAGKNAGVETSPTPGRP